MRFLEQALPPAGQHFFGFIGAEAEIVRNAFGCICHALFSSGGEGQNRQHQCLAIGDGHGSGCLFTAALGLWRSGAFCPVTLE